MNHYYNPFLNAPSSTDARYMERINRNPNERNEVFYQNSQVNPIAFQQPPPLQQNINRTQQHEWTPWLPTKQTQEYRAPDWGILQMPTSTRGHLSEGAPPRSQGPQTIFENKNEPNPLLEWQRPIDPRSSQQLTNNQHDITDTWKRAEMTKTHLPQQLNDEAIRITRGLQTR